MSLQQDPGRVHEEFSAKQLKEVLTTMERANDELLELRVPHEAFQTR